ncbi:MAG: helix-turn-helix transcriptional regulator [Clostridiales bacterium]|nr:helix-turn-helix transcriptional regulator [Clostridiales bacterium]
MDIVKKVDEMRVKRGWTFYKLAQESGLTQQTFTKWMEGKTMPTIQALQLVCDAFNITLANFFAENDMIEITPELKGILDNWVHLTKDEQQSIKLIIDNYISRKN